MRYGRNYPVLSADQVETPDYGINAFIDAATNTLFGKYPDGVARPLYLGGDSPFAAQAINESEDADKIEVSIDGVASYVDGDYYSIYITENNTGATTMNINEIGEVDVVVGGDNLAPVPAERLVANTTNIFIYISGNFHWIGQVNGDKATLIQNVTFAELDAVAGGGTTATYNAFYLPAGADLVKVVDRQTVSVAGGGITAATHELAEKASGVDIFDGAVDIFAAPAGDKGGYYSGIQLKADIFDQLTFQAYEATDTTVGDGWSAATQGNIRYVVTWSLLSSVKTA